MPRRGPLIGKGPFPATSERACWALSVLWVHFLNTWKAWTGVMGEEWLLHSKLREFTAFTPLSKVNLNSYHLGLQNSIWDWAVWPLDGKQECYVLSLHAGQSLWTPPGEGGDRSPPHDMLSRGSPHVLVGATVTNRQGSLYVTLYCWQSSPCSSDGWALLPTLVWASTLSPKRGFLWLLTLFQLVSPFIKTWVFLDFLITSLLVCISVSPSPAILQAPRWQEACILDTAQHLAWP